jgi:hypothetical protein
MSFFGVLRLRLADPSASSGSAPNFAQDHRFNFVRQRLRGGLQGGVPPPPILFPQAWNQYFTGFCLQNIDCRRVKGQNIENGRVMPWFSELLGKSKQQIPAGSVRLRSGDRKKSKSNGNSVPAEGAKVSQRSQMGFDDFFAAISSLAN